MGFWHALSKIYPSCEHQRCWDKTANILNKVPASLQGKVKQSLHEIWMAETKKEAEKAFNYFIRSYESKHPKAVARLSKDRKELLAFYNFPAEHWTHIRATNPIESTFSTVRLRSSKARNCGSRETTFKLMQSAQKRWKNH